MEVVALLGFILVFGLLLWSLMFVVPWLMARRADRRHRDACIASFDVAVRRNQAIWDTWKQPPGGP